MFPVARRTHSTDVENIAQLRTRAAPPHNRVGGKKLTAVGNFDSVVAGQTNRPSNTLVALTIVRRMRQVRERTVALAS